MTTQLKALQINIGNVQPVLYIIQGTPADKSTGVFLSGVTGLNECVGEDFKPVFDVLLLKYKEKKLKKPKKSS